MEQHKHGSYGSLAVELAIDFVIMYFVMYTMIATVDHLYLNVSNVYMTLMMVAPMGILMLIFMRSMYPSRRLNAIIIGSAAVGDAQFLRSMIPHHFGAILTCEQSAITAPEIVRLCGEIVQTQKEEIAKMQAILARY